MEWPEPELLAELFQRLLAGGLVARNQFASAVLDPLVAHLRRSHWDADEHACLSAAEDAVLSLLFRPDRYDAAQRGLRGYLQMAAERDLLNVLERERRHHTHRERSDCVELAPDHRNTVADGHPFDDPRLAVEIAAFTTTEREIFDLMRSGERGAPAFAAVLDIGHLPPDEQAREVKRVKDRIIQRLKRARGNT